MNSSALLSYSAVRNIVEFKSHAHMRILKSDSQTDRQITQKGGVSVAKTDTKKCLIVRFDDKALV